jgi:hypothetical protein
MGDDLRLVCPACGQAHPAQERFCEACGMPLVRADATEAKPSERRRRARKIKPQYAQGALVKVARAANGVEAEFIAGLLLEEGIPSVLSRSAGFDVAEFLVAGPRDVLVPESAAQAAREALSPAPRTAPGD